MNKREIMLEIGDLEKRVNCIELYWNGALSEVKKSLADIKNEVSITWNDKEKRCATCCYWCAVYSPPADAGCWRKKQGRSWFYSSRTYYCDLWEAKDE